MLDVAVDADGAAVDDPPRAAGFAPPRSPCRTAVALTARYSLVAKARLPIDRGDVVDDLDTRRPRARATRVAQIAGRRHAEALATCDSGPTMRERVPRRQRRASARQYRAPVMRRSGYPADQRAT